MRGVKMESPINGVIAFGPGRDAPGPLIGAVRVFAALDPSPNYPDARISLSHPDIGAVTMTCEQAIGLEERLADARASVDAALDAVPFEPVTLTAATTCDCCGYEMPVGTVAVALSDDRRSDFYAHFGRCPMTWQTISIAADAVPGTRRVRALVNGMWAMHRPLGWRNPREWMVTHVPAGRAARFVDGWLPSRNIARQLVQRLGDECSQERHAQMRPGSAEWREVAKVARGVLTEAGVLPIVKDVTRG